MKINFIPFTLWSSTLKTIPCIEISIIVKKPCECRPHGFKEVVEQELKYLKDKSKITSREVDSVLTGKTTWIQVIKNKMSQE